MNAGEPGPLVIVGGGGTPEMVRKHFVEIAGGKKARIAVLPQASSRPNRGEASVEVYSKLGAGEVYSVSLDDSAKARAMIEKATAIWFPGGSQSQLFQESLPHLQSPRLPAHRHSVCNSTGETKHASGIYCS